MVKGAVFINMEFKKQNIMNTCTLKIGIVAVGYDRPDAMLRLLNSLYEADYLGDRVDLIISVDKGSHQSEIVELANSFSWPFGEKTVRAFPERQGLKKHIIQCGNFALTYDAVVILEDDLTVSKGFYAYTKQAVMFYCNDAHIGGISLYKHPVNECDNHFFEPEFNGYDAFLVQFAQSWGECWTTRMWEDFITWYDDNNDKVFSSPEFKSERIPDNILHWGAQSWKKYFIEYVVENDLYFLFPHHSLSTNHSEVGQHNNSASADWQVETTDTIFDYRFPEFEQAVKYDVFFERLGYKVKGFEDQKVILDLYGNKKNFSDADILISSNPRAFKLLDSWKLKYRPQERNCSFPEKGAGIYVYDLHTPLKKSKERNNQLVRTRFDVRAMHWGDMIKLGTSEFFDKVKRKIKSKIKK